MIFLHFLFETKICSAVYETRTYGAMRGARGAIPYIYFIHTSACFGWLPCYAYTFIPLSIMFALVFEK